MEKTRPFLFGFLIVPLLAVMMACNKEDNPFVSNLEFSITVPVGWNFEEDINDSIRYYAVSPYRINDVPTGQDTIKEDMIILKDQYLGTLEEYYVFNQFYYDALLYSYDSISTEELVINGYDFIKHINLESIWLPSLSDPEVDIEIALKVARYYVMKDDDVYMIICAATPDTPMTRAAATE